MGDGVAGVVGEGFDLAGFANEAEEVAAAPRDSIEFGLHVMIEVHAETGDGNSCTGATHEVLHCAGNAEVGRVCRVLRHDGHCRHRHPGAKPGYEHDQRYACIRCGAGKKYGEETASGGKGEPDSRKELIAAKLGDDTSAYGRTANHADHHRDTGQSRPGRRKKSY